MSTSKITFPAANKSFRPPIHQTPKWLIDTIRQRIEGGSTEYLTQARQVLEKLQSQNLSQLQNKEIGLILRRIDTKLFLDCWGMNLKVFSNQHLPSGWTCSD